MSEEKNTKSLENQKQVDEHYKHRAIETALRISFIALIFVMSFWILKPFLAPVLWGIVFAVGIYPLHTRLAKLLGGKEKLSAILISLIGVLLIVIPIIAFASSTVESVYKVVDLVNEGTLAVPKPDVSVSEWPVVGERIYDTWSLASKSLSSVLTKFEPQLKEVAPKLTSMVTSVFGSVFLFLIAIIIGGALLLVAEQGKIAIDKIFKVFVGDKAENFSELSATTIRSVVQGVVGIAVIQSLFLSIGLYTIDMPAAGIFSIVILIVAIMQLPAFLIMLPIIIYVFSYEDTTPAVLFAIWSIVWGLADNFLKPIFLGKGIDVPMLVVLLGSIGGMIVGGPVGLFLGSVILALAYKIFMAMLEE